MLGDEQVVMVVDEHQRLISSFVAHHTRWRRSSWTATRYRDLRGQDHDYALGKTEDCEMGMMMMGSSA